MQGWKTGFVALMTVLTTVGEGAQRVECEGKVEFMDLNLQFEHIVTYDRPASVLVTKTFAGATQFKAHLPCHFSEYHKGSICEPSGFSQANTYRIFASPGYKQVNVSESPLLVASRSTQVSVNCP